MQKTFLTIYQYFLTRKPLLYILFLCTFGLFLLLASRIRFIEDVYAIIPKDEKTEKVAEVFSNSKFADKLAIMVSLKDTVQTAPDSLVVYGDALGASLEQSAAPYIKNIRYRIDDDFTLELFQTIQEHLPVFLSERDYAKIDTLIQPAVLKTTLENDIKLLSSPGSFAINDVIDRDPSGISFIALKKLQELQVDDNFELYDNHIITKDQKTLLLFITPNFTAGNTGKNKLLFEALNRSIDSVGTMYPKVQALYFGGALVSEGNATQLKKDTQLTLSITILFLVFFISIYFKKKRAPVLILVPVAYGAAFALGFIALFKGSISIIALGTGSIVLGIVVNYSLHVFNHYRHTGDMRQVIKDLSFPLTIGSFTTIAGFLTLQFATSDMLKDLGLFAGLSLIGAVLCSLIFLPHFIGNTASTPAREHSWIDRIAAIRLESNKWLVGLIVLLTIVFSFFAGKVQFEPDMMQLNYMSAELKQAEQKLNRISGAALKSVYLVTEGRNLDEALVKSERLHVRIEQLRAAGKISSAGGVSSLFMSDSLQQARIARWNAYWTAGKKDQLLLDIKNQGTALGFKTEAFQNFGQLLHTSFAPLEPAQLSGIRKSYLDDYIAETPGRASVVTLLKTPQAFRQAVTDSLESGSDATILDRQYLTSRLTQMVNQDFNRIAWIVSILVAVVLFLTFGRIELMLMAFIPMFISWVWILGIMGMAGIKFNIVNIIVSTLIFGLGDDYSLFVMDGLLSEYRTGRKLLGSYKSSILISAITTIAGLGVLIFAKHPALRSIAFISVTGIVCVVLMAQVLIPFFFALLIKNRIKKQFHPWTLWSWHRSSFSFLYFTSTSVLLTIVGFFLVRLNPFNKAKGKYIYHVLLSKFCMSVLYIMGNFRKKINNPLNETFKTPAVVIANHQSFLDILKMAMLNPRLILLTNRWVWKSPVFGWAIRMADFYPVANGIENSVPLLKTLVDKGYSIVVFPEGTRSPRPPMKRFHKGAFYLAEKLQLDIVPVLLHGLGYTMTKGDYLLKNGPITAQYLPRIKADNASWGTNYQERTKSVSKYFREQHAHLTRELEQPNYFKEQLFFNYIYKGPVLEWYLKVKLRLENYYQQFHKLMPAQGRILDLGCGYGFLCYILYWSSQEKRQITGVDYDEEKIETAHHCFSRTDDVHFMHADISQFVFEQYDGIVISDVLHYLQPEQQVAVIERAIHSLLPGGTLVIRDGDKDLKEKHKGTKLTEFFSTKVFSFNKTINELHFLSGQMISDLAGKHGLSFERIDHTKYTSNVIWVLRKV
ncbi:trifunctional MMPL family transporter/lysophospholipid acyltransferase/class I SAM-dependent methyltransferase [Niabella sp.]|uniref:trifunctional MMPL family transporter/lysophospholipid acyltransferase/class I SAM-dependent methyltransferase n=1 Tax=Niabella sp. TaxID=1962976 RepID=UPI002634A525|nr:trifunctional MMPL family transporter/lysophospholipid acyltransferase/class I SAM-dependent methyltransferase [Niabella sp.]